MKKIFWLILGVWMGGIIELKAVPLQTADSSVLAAFWDYARMQNLAHLPVNERIPLIGTFFLT